MALYFDDFLDEDEEEREGEEILIDLKKIVDDMDDVESLYEDEDDEEEDLSF